MIKTQEHITAIREACIRANPDIAKPCPCPKGGIYDDGSVCQRCDGSQWWVDRPIRLADVLLAMQGMNYVTIDPSGDFWISNTGGRSKLGESWDLRADDLSQQSPETIGFIHSLLA
jgi:hypothetical protein